MNNSEPSPLIDIQIASPCHADWSAMQGDAEVRNCQSCRKNVYNISEMSRAAAEKLIREKEGNLCLRFYRRADGTIITDDCPVGVKVVKRSVRGAAKAVAAAAAVVLGLLPGVARAHQVRKHHAAHPTVSAKEAARHRRAVASRRTRTMGRVALRRQNTVIMGAPPPPPVHDAKPLEPVVVHPEVPKTHAAVAPHPGPMVVEMGSLTIEPAYPKSGVAHDIGVMVEAPSMGPLPRVIYPEPAPSSEQ